MESKRIIEPFMYIEQPLFAKPSVFMQEHAYSKSNIEAGDMEEMEKTESSKAETNQVIVDDKTKFRDLTVSQQISYLISTPREMPPLRCEVQTDQKKYRGIMIGEKEENIVLRIFGRENEIINKNEIINVRLIGF